MRPFFFMEAIGYHGTTKKSASKLLSKGFTREESAKPLWLGDGLYFFQDAPLRASSWAIAKSLKENEAPFVMRALIQTNDVIDFIDVEHWEFFRPYIEALREKPSIIQGSPSLLFKYRSDLEEEIIFKHYEDHYYVSKLAKYYEEEESRLVAAIRASFIQGRPIHENSWLLDESHVQICVRSPNAIVRMDWYKITENNELQILSTEEMEQLCGSDA